MLPGPDKRTTDEERGRGKLLPSLSLPKNRSTSSLATSADPSDRSRYRMSFDATSPVVLDHDPMTRFVLASRPLR
jgi:protein-serine/threonine kinase